MLARGNPLTLILLAGDPIIWRSSRRCRCRNCFLRLQTLVEVAFAVPKSYRQPRRRFRGNRRASKLFNHQRQLGEEANEI